MPKNDIKPAPRRKSKTAAPKSAAAPATEAATAITTGAPPLDEQARADAALALFHPITAQWFRAVFETVTAPQREGWPAIAAGDSTLILAPTGTGKTLTAFLWCLDKLMLRDPAPASEGVRVLYISPLKALAVDVERNLRSPLQGIANMARREGVPVRMPEISVRTGDTSPKDRARFKRHPGEILITTPESLYLLLTSSAGEALRSVETVIIDEIHALVPTKRGAHLALSLERLQALCNHPIQRIGLSATQRPLEEVARFLGGAQGQGTTASAPEQPTASTDLDLSLARTTEAEPAGIRFRPVTIVNAGARKTLDLRVEVPVEDMARLGQIDDLPSGPASQGPKRTSIWQSIHPRLLEIIRGRTSTLIFVNARRVAERLAGALNELAGEDIARAHHGSLAAAQRSEIEERLKAGNIRALVCTSSLELGIDMGAVDLVVQIEAPPSVASGMQRIGRAGHSVGAPSNGIIFPKYRADLIACAAVTQAMHQGHVESTRFLRNPLDVLAQQIVAIIAHPPQPLPEEQTSPSSRPESSASLAGDAAERPLYLHNTRGRGKARTARKPARIPATTYTAEDPEADSPGISYAALYALIRSAASFAALTPSVFDGVLDMLAGRYPSDEFAELRPRITWDRATNHITPRGGVKRIAILNGGTIPDRGLYGVFLSGSQNKPIRVGELDEEMVFEARTGETFVLGASTWRIDEITHDRVLVSPAPGEPGKMPFWHGDQAGRPIEFGRRIGALMRELRDTPRSAAITRLTREHDLDPQAAENVLRYLADQELATGQVPDDRTIVIERVRDELGDWRVCCLTPFGSRIHAPWAMAATARLKAAGQDVETMWSEDGFVLRFPEADAPPEADLLLLEPEEAAELVQRQLGSTALFAAKFREAASRALLLPRRRADGRTPLWQQRKRAYDLLSVASRYPSFPMLLEAYRECLRDVFDMPALAETLRAISNRSIRVHVTDSRTPSPFAGALLFSYVANYIYDGDAPLAERRAQALSIDQDQLRELMGDADLRELLDLSAIEETEEQLQCLVDPFRARSADAIHDLLLRLGDLTREELRARSTFPTEPPLLPSETPATPSETPAFPTETPALSSDTPHESLSSRPESSAHFAEDAAERPLYSPSSAVAKTRHPERSDLRSLQGAQSKDLHEIAPQQAPQTLPANDPTDSPLTTALNRLLRSRRILELLIAGQKRLVAVEDAARLRDALGVPLPPGLPTAFLQPAPDALTDITRRFARTHGPFTTQDIAARYGLAPDLVETTLQRLVQTGRVIEGGFRPGGTHREWLDAEVLRTIRRKSLAKLRKEVEPVAQRTLARLFTRWQGTVQPRRGLDALLDTIENLQGAPLPASILETEILPARILGYKPADLDTLIAAGEVTWAGLDPLGERDGRIALFLSEKLPLLWPPNRTLNPALLAPTTAPSSRPVRSAAETPLYSDTARTAPGERSTPRNTPFPDNPLSDRELAILHYLRQHGASFFQPLHDAIAGGYPGETIDALWSLVWRGLLTNDAVHALRAYTDRSGSTTSRNSKPTRRVHQQTGFRSRRTTPPTAQGRWSLNPAAFITNIPAPISALHPTTAPSSRPESSAHFAEGAAERPLYSAAARANPAATPQQSTTAWSHATAHQLLTRYGVVFRETAHAESLPGGFSAIYDVLKALEESGRVRRGYFAADLGATQFAMPAAVDLLRSLRTAAPDDTPEVVLLAATDPANPYGTLLRWPTATSTPDPNNPGAPANPTSLPASSAPFAEEASHGLPTKALSSRPESSAPFAEEASPGLPTKALSSRPESSAPFAEDGAERPLYFAAHRSASPLAGKLAATDPDTPNSPLTRSVGARVILVDGALTAYLRRGNPNLQVLLPTDEPDRSRTARALADFLVARFGRPLNPHDPDTAHDPDARNRTGLLITTINGIPVAEHPLARFLVDAGFQPAPTGFNIRRNLPQLPRTQLQPS